MSNQAFLADGGLLDGAAVGGTLVLDGPEGHHAVTVKRVRPGEHVDLVDGQGRRAVCLAETADAGALGVRVVRLVDEPEPAVATVLVQALAKGDRDLQAVEAAVELGVDGIVPWQAERCVVRWNAQKAPKALAKWAATVRAAAKQSRRARLPGVDGAATTAQLAARTRAETEAGRLVVVLHEEADAPLAEAVGDWLGRTAGAPGRAVLLVVGPEGGIAPGEVEQLRAAGAAVASLGTNVLRASTAGPAALVLVRHLAGTLG